jgi:hypothetical protein
VSGLRRFEPFFTSNIPKTSCFTVFWVLRGVFLSLFTVIPLILLISGRAWEADFVAIYGDPAHFADLRASLGSRFSRYLR